METVAGACTVQVRVCRGWHWAMNPNGWAHIARCSHVSWERVARGRACHTPTSVLLCYSSFSQSTTWASVEHSTRLRIHPSTKSSAVLLRYAHACWLADGEHIWSSAVCCTWAGPWADGSDDQVKDNSSGTVQGWGHWHGQTHGQ